MENLLIWTNDYDQIESIAQLYMEDGHTRNTAIDRAYADNDYTLGDIRYCAKSANVNKILCYGRLGRWNGTAYGYKILDKLEDVFYSDCDDIEWSLEDDDLVAYGSHHDGNNKYLYRVITCDNDELDELIDLIYNSGSDEDAVKEYLEKYTTSLKDVLCKCGII